MPDPAPKSRLKLSLPVFSGEGSTDEVSQNFQTFIENFESYLTTMGITEDKDKLAALRQALKPQSAAERWYVTQTRDPVKVGNAPTWDDVKALMEKRFDLPKTPISLAGMRSSLVQLPKESVREFADRVTLYQIQIDKARGQAAIVDVTAAQRKACVGHFSVQDQQILFLQGINADIRAILSMAAQPATMEELVENAGRAEESLQARTGRAGAAVVDQVDAVGGTGRRAQFPPSGRPGWIKFTMLPRGMCYTCGNMGHIATACKVPVQQQKWTEIVQKYNLRPPAKRNQAVAAMDESPTAAQQASVQQATQGAREMAMQQQAAASPPPQVPQPMQQGFPQLQPLQQPQQVQVLTAPPQQQQHYLTPHPWTAGGPAAIGNIYPSLGGGGSAGEGKGASTTGSGSFQDF